MNTENKQRYDAKLKRIKDAISLKETDQIPMTPPTGLFPILNAGYTVAEVIYDTTLEKLKKSAVKYLNEFDPDSGINLGFSYAGEGPAMELSKPKNMRWAGMPGKIIDDNSIQQFIEFPLLLDDEFEEFFSDRTGWELRKSLFRSSGLLEPLSKLTIGGMLGGTRHMAAQFSTPEFKQMIEDLWKINDFYENYQNRMNQLNALIEDMGYPLLSGGMAAVPFDMYSDGLRGTILSLQDLYDNTEYVEKYIEEAFEKQIAMLKAGAEHNKGKHVFMALHKGMDGFMSDEHYRKYYWKHLQQIILTIIEAGKVPYIFTEGKYNSRLDCLSEVPPGKVFYHFEEVNMANAKKKLGGIACISGGFSTNLLQFGTRQQVIDECKRLVDICAPGGGFIFETGSGLSHVKRENVEAMFETVREYGKK